MDCSLTASVAETARTVICVQSPPSDWRAYLTPFLALVSIIVAYRAIVNARRMARQRATLDFIEKVESGDHYRHIVQTFSDLRRGPGFEDIMNPQTKQSRELRRCVNDYLNHYEMVAIGIREGILDEQIYRDWMRGPFVRDWNAATEWVQNERWKRQEDGSWEYYDKTFENYGLLAARWSPDTIILNEDFGPPRDEARGPSQDPLPADSEDASTSPTDAAR
ncbi:MAG: DUF4760 domain-containing protein [Pseudomonadota bacterium]